MTKHIRTVIAPAMQETIQLAACTDCAVSCQSACKTSCTVGNIVCSAAGLLSPNRDSLGQEEKHIQKV